MISEERRAEIEAAGERSKAERIAQGLEPTITDPLFYRKLYAAYGLVDLAKPAPRRDVA